MKQSAKDINHAPVSGKYPGVPECCTGKKEELSMKWFVRGITVLAALAIAGGAVAYVMLTGTLPLADAGLQPGAEMPDFKMEDYNGKEHSLKEYRGKIVVLDFCSQHCPFSRGADKQLITLTKKYKDNKDVVFLGIDSHHSTKPEEIKEYAEKRGLIHPILKDVDNAYADKTGAQVTPEIYIVGRDGKLAYRGAFDNRTGPEQEGDKHYAADAIAALLAGEAVEPARVKAWGCTIKVLSIK
jgi:peroxiredoxin